MAKVRICTIGPNKCLLLRLSNKFRSLCLEAEKLDEDNDYSDCTILEPLFQQILSLGKAAEDKTEFIGCLVDVVKGKVEVPSYMLPYVMRYFKFQEVLVASTEHLGDPPNPRYMNFHSDIVHAVEDEKWEDAVFWEYMK